jgi:hypothetical protein
MLSANTSGTNWFLRIFHTDPEEQFCYQLVIRPRSVPIVQFIPEALEYELDSAVFYFEVSSTFL